MSSHGEALARDGHVDAARYNLTDLGLSSLTAELVAEKSSSATEGTLCYSIDTDSPYADVARSVEREVFEKWFGNDAEVMASEYGPYEEQSLFFLSVDVATKTPVGVMRVIKNGPNGLKTMNDLESMAAEGDPQLPKITASLAAEQHNIESYEDCWDVGTVGVRKQYKELTADASVQLYRALYVSAMEHDVKHFVSIIDSKPLEKMKEFLGIPFVPMVDSEPFSYLGSKSSEAVYGYVPEFYETMKKARWRSLKRIMARKAFMQLVEGSKDRDIYL